jgi:hypothetical protein
MKHPLRDRDAAGVASDGDKSGHDGALRADTAIGLRDMPQRATYVFFYQVDHETVLGDGLKAP